MRAIRRLYFYIVAFISLQVILWGLITLISSILNAPVGGGLANLLARGLSQILVGIPILWIHWRVIQNDLRDDPEEHGSLIRAIFTYGLRLATLIPVLTNLHAILRRPLLIWFGVPSPTRNFLASTSLVENVITILINLLFYYFALRLLDQDREVTPRAAAPDDIRRIYRIIWMVIAIGSLVVGVQEIIFSILYQTNATGVLNNLKLASGISVTLIAVTLWAIMTREIEITAEQVPSERKHILRTIFLFTVTLSGIAVVLSLAGVIIQDVLLWIFGEATTLREYINDHSSLLASLIPFGVIWTYYQRNLRHHIAAQDHTLREAGMQRLFASILALAGNILVFIGTWILLTLIADTLWQRAFVVNSMRNQLSSGLVLLAIGTPLWGLTWPKLQQEALKEGERQDRARQSVIRKTYLYLFVFASVVGLMASTGWLAYRLINALLGNFMLDPGLFILKQILLIGLVVVWLIYHLSSLRRDGRAAWRTLQNRHANFHTILLSNAVYKEDMQALAHLLHKQLPQLSVQQIDLDENISPVDVSEAAAIVYPATTDIEKSKDMADILDHFSGRRILLPLPDEQIIWAGVNIHQKEQIFHSAVELLRQGAEGQEMRVNSPANAWSIVGYIATAIVGLELLFLLFALVVNVIMN